MSLLYESYHKRRKLQRRIVSETNFTYRNIFTLFKKYIVKPINILDIGCGVGTIDFYLASKGNFVTGIDISKKAVLIAKKNAHLLGVSKKTKFLIGNFPTSKVKQKFDLVVMSEVIEHLPNDQDVIGSIYKQLAKGGILILSTRSVNEVLYKIGLEKKHDKIAGHLRRYSESSLEKIIKSFGFKILGIKKTEGVLRDSLFVFPFLGNSIVRLANKYTFISDIVTFVDNFTLKLFGESQIFLIAKKW